MMREDLLLPSKAAKLIRWSGIRVFRGLEEALSPLTLGLELAPAGISPSNL